jgi:hypothetical protein
MNTSVSMREWKPFRSSMFDTIKVKVWIKHPPLQVLARPGSAVTFTGKRYKVAGEFPKCRATLFSDYACESLMIEASPSKYLTGQNIVGRENLKALAIELIENVLVHAGIDPTDEERDRYQSGDFELLRVDYVTHVDCGTSDAARAFLLAVRASAAGSGAGYSAYKDETVYWGQHSRRRTLCVYRKGSELMRRPLGRRVYGARFLTKRAQSLVRFELTLRAGELGRLALRSPEAWCEQRARHLLKEAMERVLPADRKIPSVAGMSSLPRSLQDRLELWLRGSADAFTRYSDSALRESRRVILLHTGIDIKSTLNLDDQRKFFVTIKELSEAGGGFKSWKRKWEKLRQGVED